MNNETFKRCWNGIKHYSKLIVSSILVALAWLVAACFTVGSVGLIYLLLLGIIAVAYSGRALVIVLVATLVILFTSLLMYQDLSLFTIISNYLAQYL